MLAQLMLFAGNFAPRGWAFCNGQLMSIAQNQALFSLLGTTYGGDGRTTFGLPDLRGRGPVHSGTGPGLTPRNLGQRFGTEWNYLTSNQLAPHTHSFINVSSMPVLGTATAEMNVNNSDNDAGEEPNGAFLGKNDAGAIYASAGDGSSTLASSAIVMDDDALAINASSMTISATGASTAFNNMQPVLVMNWCIALVGFFPSRS